MLSVTDKDLDKMAVESNKKIGELRVDLVDIEMEIGKLHGKKSQIEKDLKSEECKFQAIKKARVLNAGFPKGVLELRGKLLTKIERSKSEEITIGTKKRLDSEINTAKKELQATCEHPFVFHETGYEGSYSQDYEDSRPSIRRCVVCNFVERAKDLKRDARLRIASDFEVLGETEKRLILSEPYRPYPERLSSVDVWVHIAVALKPFEDFVVKALSS